MVGDPGTGPDRLATGGPSLARVHRKKWWQELQRRVERVLARVAAEDPLNRSPAAWTIGEDATIWHRWLASRGVRIDQDQVGMTLAVDALAPVSPAAARDNLSELHRRTTVGGRLLLVERVVRTPQRAVRDISDLLVLVSGATGGAVTLADVAAIARPDEPHPSTVALELVRLAIPEDV